jgi:hypothetical protein
LADRSLRFRPPRDPKALSDRSASTSAQDHRNGKNAQTLAEDLIMIIVRVELHSAITREVSEIARMHISNIGGSRQVGHYHAKTYRGRSSDQLSRGVVQRQGSIRNYPRLKIHVSHHVARALIAMKYAGDVELEQPTELFDVINGAVPGERAP